MRYFSITVNVLYDDGRIGWASTQLGQEKFPSFNFLLDYFKSKIDDKITIVISNIFEFKNEEDYLSFLGNNISDYEKWLNDLFDYLKQTLYMNRESFDKFLLNNEEKLEKCFETSVEFKDVLSVIKN